MVTPQIRYKMTDQAMRIPMNLSRRVINVARQGLCKLTPVVHQRHVLDVILHLGLDNGEEKKSDRSKTNHKCKTTRLSSRPRLQKNALQQRFAKRCSRCRHK